MRATLLIPLLALALIGAACSAAQSTPTGVAAPAPMAGGGLVTIAGFTTLGLWFLAVSIAMLIKPRPR